MKYIIISHRDCDDGMAAAWAAKQGLLKHHIDEKNITVRFHVHRDVPDMSELVDAHVIFTDFIFPSEETMRGIFDDANQVDIYDHHATAKEVVDKYLSEEIPTLGHVVFDMNRSGAGIAWDEMVEETRPAFIDLIEDNDLWRFNYEHTKPFMAAIRTRGTSFEQLDNMLDWTSNQYENFINLGTFAEMAKNRMVEQSMAFAREVLVDGEKVNVCNVPYYLCSEVAHECIGDNAVGITWYQDVHGTYKLSFRSTDGESAKNMAVKYGGGGHGNAAGATVEVLPWT